MKRIVVDPGFKVGQLTVVQEVKPLFLPCGQINRAFECLCECGNKTIVRIGHLIRAKTLTCGCLHGESHNQAGTKLYSVWRAMKERCYAPYVNSNNKKIIKTKALQSATSGEIVFLSSVNGLI